MNVLKAPLFDTSLTIFLSIRFKTRLGKSSIELNDQTVVIPRLYLGIRETYIVIRIVNDEHNRLLRVYQLN